MDQQKIGDFISSLRKEKGYTQEQLGNIVGVTGKAVSRWERCLSIPDVSIINKVSETLGTTTTELLNGERVVDITKQNLDDITENSVAFYKAKLKQKFKKCLIILVTVIFFVVFGIQFLFYMNNYDKYKVYEVYSNSAELDVKGLVVETQDRTTIVMSDFEYYGSIMNDIYSVDYEVYLNGKVISTGGKKAESIKRNNDSRLIDIREIFNNMTIYINNNEKYSLKDIKDFYVNFKYNSYNGDTADYQLPLKIERKFSNNKLVYN